MSMRAIRFGQAGETKREEKKEAPRVSASSLYANFQLPTFESEASFSDCLELFQQLGGRIEPQINLEEKAATHPTFTIQEGETVYPICQVGAVRSQLAALELKKQAAEAGIRLTVCDPHGALYGLDPFGRPWQLGRMKDEEIFKQATGVSRTPRRLTATLAKAHSVIDAKTNALIRADDYSDSYESQIHASGREAKHELSRQIMNRHFFSEIIRTQGRVIAFVNSVHVMMARLVEVACVPTSQGFHQSNIKAVAADLIQRGEKPLAGVILNPIVASDPIASAKKNRNVNVVTQTNFFRNNFRSHFTFQRAAVTRNIVGILRGKTADEKNIILERLKKKLSAHESKRFYIKSHFFNKDDDQCNGAPFKFGTPAHVHTIKTLIEKTPADLEGALLAAQEGLINAKGKTQHPTTSAFYREVLDMADIITPLSALASEASAALVKYTSGRFNRTHHDIAMKLLTELRQGEHVGVKALETALEGFYRFLADKQSVKLAGLFVPIIQALRNQDPMDRSAPLPKEDKSNGYYARLKDRDDSCTAEARLQLR